MIHFANYFVAIFAFCILGIWLKELIQIASGFLLAPHFGMKLSRISLFGMQFTLQDGVWTRSKCRFSHVIQHLLTVDIQKPVPPDIEKKERILEAVRVLILFAVSIPLLILCWQPILRCVHGTGSLPDWFLAGLSVSMVWHSIVTMGIRLYVYGVMMKQLSGYNQSLINRLRAGERFADMGLRPVEELPYRNPKEMEKMMYYLFYLNAMLETGNIAAMHKPIQEMTNYFRNQDFIMSQTGNYYWLVFYYSRYELNPSAATYFLNIIRDSIEHDKDANAKRVLAYYAFGIEQDFPKARHFVNEGLACVDSFSIGAERDLERKLLLELDGFLRQKGV